MAAGDGLSSGQMTAQGAEQDRAEADHDGSQHEVSTTADAAREGARRAAARPDGLRRARPLVRRGRSKTQMYRLRLVHRATLSPGPDRSGFAPSG